MPRPADAPADAPDDARDADALPRSARPPSGRVTFDAYLAFERRHPARHEFIDGYVYPVAGARLRHNRITGRAAGAGS